MKLTIESTRGPLTLNWQNKEPLIHFSNLQGRSCSDSEFDQLFQANQKRRWHQRWGLGAYDIPENSTILDIGSGIGISNLLLAKYFPNAKFHLCDKSETTDPGPVFWAHDLNQNYFYNNWDVVEDAIHSSNLDRSRFVLAEPTIAWPKADLITSHWSWCHHYSVHVYIDRVIESLKPNGRLMVTTRVHSKEDAIQVISDRLRSKPIARIPYMVSDGPAPLSPVHHPDVWAWDCLWRKN